jgi:flavin-dependent dehydrogenase
MPNEAALMQQADFDVIVLGGAFSGAATALLLRRDHPHLRVLVVEKLARFDEKVGEATTEMSAMFLTRRLALWQHLEREHLPKEGLRFWFTNRAVTGHANASETGGFLRSAVPSFQLRRDVLDEHVLKLARLEGAEVRRPVRVRDVELGDFDHRVTIEHPGARMETLRTRWVIDATGRAALLGSKLGLIDRSLEHPTAALWCRWRDVRHIDDLAALAGGPLARANLSSRRLATNHYAGFGYWVWVIPLGNGETSVGVVWDKRHIGLHERQDRLAAYQEFLRAIPALTELFAGATPRQEDLRYYSHLPYVTRRYMGNGWALVGDAAAFLDPYYSPGLDHAAFSVEATVRIVGLDMAASDNGPGTLRAGVEAAIDDHNTIFLRSFARFYRAVYRNKYEYMGEHDLLSAAMLLDTAQYYIFVVIPAYRGLGRFDWMPVLGPRPAGLNYALMCFYNRRFASIARARRLLGRDGLRNEGRRIKAYFALDHHPFRMALRGAKLWFFAEADLAVARLGLKPRHLGVAARSALEIASPAPGTRQPVASGQPSAP